MLQPANRLTLIDAMRPPAGYSFEAAMAVTFTLDLRALLAAPAAFALSGSVDTKDEPSAEPIELLHAVRTHAANITVFAQAGEIALPPSRKVFAFLERSVVQVTAPRHGVIHPKVWVLRYRADDGDDTRLRVLVASRNLTFDTSWDTVVRLDQTARGRRCGVAPIGSLFELLASRAHHLDPTHGDRVRTLCDDLTTATFALPPGADDLHVHVLGTSQPMSPLPPHPDRSLVIAPFVSDDFFSRVHQAPIDELVSRRESLDQLSRTAQHRVERLWVFDDGEPEHAPDPDGDDRHSPSDPGRLLQGLHAKLFAFEEGDRARVFCGSANATAAAFSSNLEVLVELVGATGSLGIDRLCEGSGEAAEQGLRQLFATYTPAEGQLEEPLEEASSLDSLRRRIASIGFDGHVKPHDGSWAVLYRSRAPLPVAEGVEIRCWPLTTPANQATVSGDEPLHTRFETSLESMSGFLAFKLEAPELHESTEFVVPVQLHNVPPERDRDLMRLLIGNAERFLRYLLALLDDRSAPSSFVDSVERLEGASNGLEGGGLALPVLEKLIRALQHDPGRLHSLHPLVTHLADDDVLPPGFAELWETLHAAALQRGAGR